MKDKIKRIPHGQNTTHTTTTHNKIGRTMTHTHNKNDSTTTHTTPNKTKQTHLYIIKITLKTTTRQTSI